MLTTPKSNTCLPLPLTPAARALPLLSPLAHPTICAFSSERFELRTGGLGCAVSTLTFLACVVTIFCTLAATLLGWAAVRLGVWVGGVWKARKGGWVRYADGREEVWVRRREGWWVWWRRVRGKARGEEVVEGEGGEGTRAWWWKWRRGGEGGSGEERPLLGG